MILRLSQKLNSKIKAGKLSALAPDENPLADWSCHLFTVERTQYILLTNTKSLYSCCMPGRGISNSSAFISRALETIREFMVNDGYGQAFEKLVGPSSQNVTFAKALNRSVTGSMNDIVQNAKFQLARQIPPGLLGTRLNHVVMSALSSMSDRDFGSPDKAFKLLVTKAGESNEQSDDKSAIPAFKRVYQFKITLTNSRPTIWRRIQVHDCTLDKLHEHIQTSMGWTNSHLHEFEINGARYGDPELLNDGFEDFECEDSTVARISEIVPKDGSRYAFQYEYDFGDGWEHEVLFEGWLRADGDVKYPLCVEGERRCPPEDVGGIPGFEEFLDVIANPRHPEHKRFLEWAGEFDPEMFDADVASHLMRMGLPNWRYM